MAGRRKKLNDLQLPEESLKAQRNKYVVADDLDKQLNIFGKDIVTMMTYGTMPELLDLSWQMYEKFKNGDVKELTGTDEELRKYFEFKKKDLIVKLLGFLEVASNSLLEPSKLKGASLKELTHSLKITLDMLNALHGTQIAKKVEHTHTHKVETVQDIDARLAQTKKELEAIEAEFEEVPNIDSHL